MKDISQHLINDTYTGEREELFRMHAVYTNNRNKMQERRDKLHDRFTHWSAAVVGVVPILAQTDFLTQEVLVFISIIGVFMSVVWYISTWALRKQIASMHELITHMEELIGITPNKMQWELVQRKFKGALWIPSYKELLIPALFAVVWIVVPLFFVR